MEDTEVNLYMPETLGLAVTYNPNYGDELYFDGRVWRNVHTSLNDQIQDVSDYLVNQLIHGELKGSILIKYKKEF